MAIVSTKCTCGELIEIRTGVDVKCTLRQDRKQAIYLHDKQKNYSIYRCRSCKQPLHKTVYEFKYEDTEK